jgi:hypothetical protein
MMRRKNEPFESILARLAEREHCSTGVILREMERAIRLGFESENPAIRAEWADVPRKGLCPTPEELIFYLAGRLAQGG